MIRIGSAGPKHRKQGPAGSHTVRTPDNYNPTHRKPIAPREEEMR